MLGHDYTGVKGLGKTTTQVKCSYFFIAGVYDVSVTINDVGIHPLVKVVCQVFPTLKLFFFLLCPILFFGSKSLSSTYIQWSWK